MKKTAENKDIQFAFEGLKCVYKLMIMMARREE